jgi:MFS family permease
VSTPARRHSASEQVEAVGRYGWLGLALVALGVGLIVNSLLGPLVLDAIDYPVSESLLNQTIGLEAVSLFLVAPLCVLAGVLALRGHAAAPVVALGPALYTAYMFLQYVIGPEYDYYPGVLPLHLALFILGAGIALAAWAAVDRTRLPQMTRRSQRRYAVVLLLLAAFVMARYLPVFIAGLSGDPLSAEYRSDVSMYWSIVLLDLGLVVPGTIAAAVALLRGATWAGTALYAVLGWFALVPPSVAAMAVVMVLNDDPHASTGQAVLLTVAAAVFAALMVRLYRPLFARRVRDETRDETRDEAGRGGVGAGPSAPAEGGHDAGRTRPGA